MSYRANRSNGPGAGPGSRYPVYPGTGASGVQGHEYLEEENTEKEEEMRKKVRHSFLDLYVTSKIQLINLIPVVIRLLFPDRSAQVADNRHRYRG